ncbi:hypothetical protein GPECTOR_124g487 [Gonium pectorale]|uniref:Peptidylprolyl isomerase n=1 Tax=Gonium pectorale TaxID=33097 RepID=A0A150FYN0_GONPE|nr:hypothetical protein GPECTOR_124g487 [Gonium pectorale]|eukprot:KXZ42687.1 hypothetical protein GPECTOR_124g487 [Gonium pectorale]
MLLKEQGNELVDKDPEAALERYAQALAVFVWFDRGPDRSAEDIPLVAAADGLQGAEREQAHHLLAVTFCNAAACLLQLGMHADAAFACSKALRYDPYSVKALYRRALAHRLAASTAGLEAARDDLAEANRLEPANHQVRLALTAVQHELREQRRKERGMYGNMFERGGELYGSGAAGGPAGGGGGDSGGGAADARSRRLRGGPDADAEEEEEGDDDPATSGRDPEDLLFKDTEDRKIWRAPLSTALPGAPPGQPLGAPSGHSEL